jgi:putative pyruvate formate lyase activating enzyme
LARHLILPGNLDNTFAVIDWISETFGAGELMFSLMSQYTPPPSPTGFPELQRQLTPDEHDAAVRYLLSSGIEYGFYQDPPQGDEAAYIPRWDLTGV